MYFVKAILLTSFLVVGSTSSYAAPGKDTDNYLLVEMPNEEGRSVTHRINPNDPNHKELLATLFGQELLAGQADAKRRGVPFQVHLTVGEKGKEEYRKLTREELTAILGSLLPSGTVIPADMEGMSAPAPDPAAVEAMMIPTDDLVAMTPEKDGPRNVVRASEVFEDTEDYRANLNYIDQRGREIADAETQTISLVRGRTLGGAVVLSLMYFKGYPLFPAAMMGVTCWLLSRRLGLENTFISRQMAKLGFWGQRAYIAGLIAGYLSITTMLNWTLSYADYYTLRLTGWNLPIGNEYDFIPANGRTAVEFTLDFFKTVFVGTICEGTWMDFFAKVFKWNVRKSTNTAADKGNTPEALEAAAAEHGKFVPYHNVKGAMLSIGSTAIQVIAQALKDSAKSPVITAEVAAGVAAIGTVAAASLEPDNTYFHVQYFMELTPQDMLSSLAPANFGVANYALLALGTIATAAIQVHKWQVKRGINFSMQKYWTKVTGWVKKGVQNTPSAVRSVTRTIFGKIGGTLARGVERSNDRLVCDKLFGVPPVE